MNNDNKLISKDLDYKTPDECKIYSPVYTPNSESQLIDNQLFSTNKKFFIESYGC